MSVNTIALPGQFRLQSGLRLSFGITDPETGYPKRSDRVLVMQRTNGKVKRNGKKAVGYQVVEAAQSALVEYGLRREVENANVPQRVPIYLAFNAPEQNLYVAYAKFLNGGRRQCYCDSWREKQAVEGGFGWQEQGLTPPDDVRDEMGNLPTEYYIGDALWQEYDGNAATAGPRKSVVCDQKTCPYAQTGKARTCKPQVVLTAFLRDIDGYSNRPVVFRSTSMTTARQLHYMMRMFVQQTGRLAGIPLWFVRGERETTTPDGKPTTVPYASLELDGSLSEVIAAADRMIARELPADASETMLALKASSLEGQDFVEEFHPELANEPEPSRDYEGEFEAMCAVHGLSSAEIEGLRSGCHCDEDFQREIDRLAAREQEGTAGVLEGEIEDDGEQQPEIPNGTALIGRMKALRDADEWTTADVKGALADFGGAFPKAGEITADTQQALALIEALNWYAMANEKTVPFAGFGGGK